MGFKTPTKEQIINGIVAPFVLILSFLLSLIPNKELVAEIVEETKKAIDGLNVETPPTEEQAVYAALEIFDTAADCTPTKFDDLAVDASKVGVDFVYKRGFGWKKILELLHLRKKAKKGNLVDPASAVDDKPTVDGSTSEAPTA